MSNLRTDFGDDFAGSAFRVIEGETRIVGKYGQITQWRDGSYDVWFVGRPATLAERPSNGSRMPLSGRRIESLARNLKQEAGFHKLDGEGWVTGRGRDFVLRCAPLAGVKNKRQLSEQTRERLAIRMRAMHETVA